MEAHEVVAAIFLGIAIIGFLASIISSFFVENGRTKLPTKKSINTKVKKQPVFKDSSYDEDESDDRSFSWSFTEKPKKTFRQMRWRLRQLPSALWIPPR